jgi:hypothetical protein
VEVVVVVVVVDMVNMVSMVHMENMVYTHTQDTHTVMETDTNFDYTVVAFHIHSYLIPVVIAYFD